MSPASNLLYVDAFAGISGDMFLAALADLGLESGVLEDLPSRLGFRQATVLIERIDRRGIAARRVVIETPSEKQHRHLHDIEGLLRKSDLPEPVAEGALKTFRKLAEAEARIHGTLPERIHFHEVGAVDSILDIVGTHLGINALAVERIECSPLPLSRGQVSMAHGLLPIPAPATVELLKGIPTYPIEVPFETVTPTGAALVATMASTFGPWPAMRPVRNGWGAGTMEGGQLPNLLRLVLGEPTTALCSDRIWVLECEVDDMLPEFFEPLWAQAFAKGALDLYLTPVQMKKGRPGTLVTLLVDDTHRFDCEQLLLTHTTTFGIRRSLCDRTILPREIIQVETRFGPIPVKLGTGFPGKASPEASAVKAAAETAAVPMSIVYNETLNAWKNLTNRSVLS